MGRDWEPGSQINPPPGVLATGPHTAQRALQIRLTAYHPSGRRVQPLPRGGPGCPRLAINQRPQDPSRGSTDLLERLTESREARSLARSQVYHRRTELRTAMEEMPRALGGGGAGQREHPRLSGIPLLAPPRSPARSSPEPSFWDFMEALLCHRGMTSSPSPPHTRRVGLKAPTGPVTMWLALQAAGPQAGSLPRVGHSHSRRRFGGPRAEWGKDQIFFLPAVTTSHS